MKTSEFKDFTLPMPQNGQYEIEIIDCTELLGKKPDENNECSSGLSFNFCISGPETAAMSDGTSAIGHAFKQNFWRPRQSLKDSKPKVANRMTNEIKRLLDGVFGDSISEDVLESDWIGRKFIAYVTSAYDDYEGETVPKINKVLTAKDLTR
jgi:hypothetical protein